MIMIEVDQEVVNKLTTIAIQQGGDCNSALHQILKHKADKRKFSNIQKKLDVKKYNDSNGIKLSNVKNIQDQLIPHIIKIIYKYGGKTNKATVDDEIFKLFKYEFNKPYYQETVSYKIPRWKHNIAWAKERAKLRHGFIKPATESGHGMWELTDAGKRYCENNLLK